MPYGVYVRTISTRHALSEAQKRNWSDPKYRRHQSRALRNAVTEEVRAKLRVVQGGESNPNWKGDEASYTAKHHWVTRRLGRPHDCAHCHNRGLAHMSYHWANVSGKYKRRLDDWVRLCARCHAKFDMRTGPRRMASRARINYHE
jgi:hypothetical protein